jgi:tetratricopeptide (TPR) repeat protein
MRKPFLAALLVSICLFASGNTLAKDQKCYAPISEYRFLDLFKKGKISLKRSKGKISLEQLITRINEYGVSFHLTPNNEKEIRQNADILSEEQLNKLLISIRDHYKAKVIILLANIAGDAPAEYEATRRIYDQLYRATRQFSEVCIEKINEPFVADSDEQEEKLVLEKGNQWNANIVIWGRLKITPKAKPKYGSVIVMFKPMREPPYSFLTQDWGTVTGSISELYTFTIQERVSKEMAYLSLLTVGLIRYELGDYDGAIERFNHGLKNLIIPKEMVNPGILYFYKAISFYQKGLIEQGKCNSNQARIYYEEAIKEGNRSIEWLPTVIPYYNLGNFYYAKWHITKASSDYNAAIENYKKAVNVGTGQKYARAYYNLGKIHSDAGDDAAALENYRLALEADPTYAPAYNNCGIIYKQKEQYDDALHHFNQAIENDIGFPDPYINRALVHHIRKDFDLAIADLNTAIELITACNCVGNKDTGFIAYFHDLNIDLNPKDPCGATGIKFILANLYRYRGRARIRDFTFVEDKNLLNASIEDFSTSINMAPDFRTYFFRGKAYKIEGNINEAAKDYTDSIARAPYKYIVAYLDRSDVYILMHRYRDAIADCEVILGSDTEEAKQFRPNAYINRGEAYYGSDEKERGLADIRQGLELNKDPKFHEDIKKELLERFGLELPNN